MTIAEYIKNDYPFYHIVREDNLDDIIAEGLLRRRAEGRYGICVVRVADESVINEIIDTQLNTFDTPEGATFALIKIIPSKHSITANVVSIDPCTETNADLYNFITKDIVITKEDVVKTGLVAGKYTIVDRSQLHVVLIDEDSYQIAPPDFHSHSFRPQWTCGRYNKEKHVAIMYNLLNGMSFFFEDKSADVIGEILVEKRDSVVSVPYLATKTGIKQEVISEFVNTLQQHGLLIHNKMTDDDILSLRKQIADKRKTQPSWTDRPTKEKLPLAVTNAEQRYFQSLEDGNTVCSVMFELTYRCSEMCIHCYNPGATRNNNEESHRADLVELNIDEYKRIIDELYDLGLVKVCLSGGDPFSKEITWEIIDYLYQKEIAFDIFTNGLRLEQHEQQLANYYPRLVGISIYSGVAEEHDAITRIPRSWERSMHVVEKLSALAIPMNLKCCVMQPNLHSYYMVADLAKRYGAQPQFEINITESNDGDICAKHLRLTEEQLQVVLRDTNLTLYVGKEAPNYGGQERDMSACSCGAGRTSFCITPSGNLQACPTFPLVYGNLKHDHVIDIIKQSSLLKTWRTSVVSDYEECGKYNYCDYCNLCVGIGYVEHGDYRKAAESNCYMAKCRYNLAQKLKEKDEPMNREQWINALQSLQIKKTDLHREYKRDK